MKKTAAFIALLIALLCLAGCKGSYTVGPFSSLIIDSDDYDSAVREVAEAFSEYEGCTLKRIGYAGDKAVMAEAKARDIGVERIIVLTSTFTTDGKDHGTVFEPDKTYEDYRWILTRATSADQFWTIVDRGYE